MSIQGQCLCGEVQFDISGDIQVIRHCHCVNCRKIHAAAFGSYAGVAPGSFTWVKGVEFIRRYESSPGNTRMFCCNCGSKLGTEIDGEIFGVTLGTIDSPVSCNEAMHIFTDRCAGWFHPSDNLPSWPGYPPMDTGDSP